MRITRYRRSFTRTSRRRATFVSPKRSLPFWIWSRRDYNAPVRTRTQFAARSVSPWWFDGQEIEDRRRWHPEGDSEPAKSARIWRHRLTTVFRQPSSFPGTYSPTAEIMAFQAPSKLMVCVRRKERAEVLHALGKTGRVGQRPGRWNSFSRIACKE